MIRSRLLLGVAAVLAGTTVILAVLGLVYNPVIVLAAVPFALATFFLWSHATGRLHESMHRRMRREAAQADGGPDRAGGRTGDWTAGDRRRSPGPDGRGPVGHADDSTVSRRTAARVLDVAPDADEAAVRRAFRARAKDLHPDAPDGDAEEFRRVRTAYDRLRTDR